jgi:hypothetical protein
MTSPAPREARVRPAHARSYPLVAPGHWYPAAVVADHLAERRRGGGAGSTRQIPDAHFEFRGGAARPKGWEPSRKTDRRARS